MARNKIFLARRQSQSAVPAVSTSKRPCKSRPFFVAAYQRFSVLMFVVLVANVNRFVLGEQQPRYSVTETDDRITVVTPHLELAIQKRGYVSGIAAQSFVDRKTGFRDAGFGLDIVDWLMEPGSDESYRNTLPPDLVYQFNNLYHGQIPKRSIEGPQICTKAGELHPRVVRGKDFVAIQQEFQYYLAAPGKNAGSLWRQWIVIPCDTRYVFTMDSVETVNNSPALFLRIDMPGHIRHKNGDTFDLIYLSYFGFIPAKEFFEDFPPDARFRYFRGEQPLPDRFIRAYRLRDPETGAQGPWLAGMTLDPAVVYDAWCHQRGYVCMIEEIGGYPIKAGQTFSAAFIVGYFDTIGEMIMTYDRYAGARAIEVDESVPQWRLMPTQ